MYMYIYSIIFITLLYIMRYSIAITIRFIITI